jgi:hypothetical protein
LSSILNALKKLENQAKDKSPDGFRQQNDQRQNLHHPRKVDHLGKKRRYFIIFTGLIFAAAAGITLNQKVRYNIRNVAEKKETRPRSPARFPVKKLAKATRVEKKSLSHQKINVPNRTGKEVKLPSAPVYGSRRVPQNVPSQKVLPAKSIKKRTIVRKGTVKKKPDVNPGRFAKIPVKHSTETEIKIQAIAWSKDPTSRLAVINGLIRKEGETIDNVLVVSIDKDAVVFDKSGQKWKQLFGF